MDDHGDVTVLLKELASGRREALGALVPLVYDQLHAIAAQHMARESDGHTLNPTAVVHEAYLRLAELDRIEWQDRQHFLAVASQAMRRVLINYAISRKTEKRGGGRIQVELDDVHGISPDDIEGLLDLDQALERLESLSARQVRVVECRFFGGMTVDETATALDISKATVKRDWVVARAWLNEALSDD